MAGTYPTNPLATPFADKGDRTQPGAVAHPFNRRMWSTVVNLGLRYGQLWPR